MKHDEKKKNSTKTAHNKTTNEEVYIDGQVVNKLCFYLLKRKEKRRISKNDRYTKNEENSQNLPQ